MPDSGRVRPASRERRRRRRGRRRAHTGAGGADLLRRPWDERLLVLPHRPHVGNHLPGGRATCLVSPHVSLASLRNSPPPRIRYLGGGGSGFGTLGGRACQDLPRPRGRVFALASRGHVALAHAARRRFGRRPRLRALFLFLTCVSFLGVSVAVLGCVLYGHLKLSEATGRRDLCDRLCPAPLLWVATDPPPRFEIQPEIQPRCSWRYSRDAARDTARDTAEIQPEIQPRHSGDAAEMQPI